MTARRLFKMFSVVGFVAMVCEQRLAGQIIVPDVDASDPASMLVPRDRRVQSLLDQAQRELSDPDGEHREALHTLQRILDDAEDVFVDTRMRLSLRRKTSQILATLPDQTRRLYQQTFGGEAVSLLRAAEDRSIREAYQQIIRRFFHTPAGAEAAFRLAAEAMDNGHLLEAARLFNRLRSEHHAAGRYEPNLTERCLLCYWRAGASEQAAVVLLDAVAEQPGLRVAGQGVGEVTSTRNARQWLQQTLGTPAPHFSGPTDQWLIPHGSSRRNGSADPVSPLFDDAWSVPLVRDHDADDSRQVEELATLLDGVAQSARDADWMTIPVLSPLVVGDLVVFPSYGLVKAVDRHSGQLQWVTVPADRTYLDAMRSSVYPGTGRMSSEMDEFLIQRAWLDATSSQISSDGARVYLVRDSGMVGGLSPQFASVAQLNHPRRAKSFNSLRAYDATGGNWLWEIGGARTRVSLPLAGSFFLGPPLAVDGTLYVLGEDLGQVRLHALSPETGEIQWSVPLVNADSDIEDNLDRRLAGLSPTYAGGLLICPTGGGLIVAVDPATRSLMWGFRYRQPQTDLTPLRMRGRPFIGIQAPGAQVASVKDLMSASRWHEGCVIAAGDSILVAPPDVANAGEERRLICLNLQDGRMLWPPRDRQEALYIGGVHGRTILLIGRRHADGVDLANGRTIWTIPLAKPSGRGVRCGPLYHLPLSTGEIATLDIAQGTLLARSPIRSGRTLGNLVASGGRLISQTATEVRSFRPRQEVWDQLARDLAAQPENVAALAVRGESRLHDGELESGLADLRHVLEVSDDWRSRRLLMTTLLEGLRSDFARNREHVEELDRLAIDPDDRGRFLATYAQGLLDAKEHAGAFEQYLRLLAETNLPTPFSHVADGREVRRDRHGLGQLARLYEAADEQMRSRLDRLVDERLSTQKPAPGADLRIRLAAALPHLRELESIPPRHSRNLVDPVRQAKQEARLLEERRRSKGNQGAAVAARLVEVYSRAGRTEPIVQLLDELETVWAEESCLEGMTGADWASAARDRDDIAALLSDALIWPTGEISVREGAGNTIEYTPLRFEGPTDPLTSSFLFLADSRGRQVAIQDGYGRLIKNGAVPMLPAGSARSLQSQYVMQRGHRAVLFLGTQFKLIHLIDGEPRVLLEDLLVETQPVTDPRFQMIQRQVTQQRGFRGQVLWSNNPGETGSVGPLNDSVFCYLRGKTLHAHDPFTGERYWTVEDAPDGAEIFADADYVLLVPLGRNSVHIYRALDGEKLGVRALPRDVVRDRRGADWGRLFLRRLVAADGRPALAMFDPVTGKDIWVRALSEGFQWSPRDGRDLCLVEADGRLTLLNAETGRVLLETKVTVPQSMVSTYVLSLPDQWILTTYRGPATDAQARLAQIRMSETDYHAVNGPVTAFQRQTGKPMWSRPVANQYLSPLLPARWPVLSMSSLVDALPLVAGQRHMPVQSRQILLLDKQTGRSIHQTDTDPRTQGRLTTFWRVSDTEPQLRLRYGMKELEISFRQKPAEQTEESADRPPAPPVPTRQSDDDSPSRGAKD